MQQAKDTSKARANQLRNQLAAQMKQKKKIEETVEKQQSRLSELENQYAELQQKLSSPHTHAHLNSVCFFFLVCVTFFSLTQMRGEKRVRYDG